MGYCNSILRFRRGPAGGGSTRGVRANCRGIHDEWEGRARGHRHSLSRWVVVLAMWALGALAPAVRAAVPDVAFAPVQLLNAPGATFRVKLADLNRDGKLDVVATTIADSMFVYLGNGDGSFGAPTTYAITSNSSLRNGTQIAIADVTKDGILDVLIARTAENKLSIFPGVGDGTLGTPVV